SLLEDKGFGKDDYKVFHPGGKIGASLLRVRELMHKGEQLPAADAKQVMSEVLIEMSRKGFGCVGVTDKGGRLLGIVTDGDLRRHMSEKMIFETAEAVMTKNPVTITADSLASAALAV